MRKTSDNHDSLAGSELDAVSGGAFPIVLAQMALAAKATTGYPDWSDRPPCGMLGPLSPWGDPLHPC
jgi:hypothetical protein